MSWYFTTGGFFTNALVNIEGTKITSIEDVTGNDNGITKVKSIIELRQNGGLEKRSKYLMDNIWVDGHKILYEEDSNGNPQKGQHTKIKNPITFILFIHILSFTAKKLSAGAATVESSRLAGRGGT